MMASNQKRLFLGIPISAEVITPWKKKLIAAQPTIQHQIRWTPPNNHHITVQFIGSVDTTKIPSLIESVNQMTIKHSAFSVTLSNLTCFPPQHPKLLSANIKSCIELQSLHDHVGLAMKRIGLSVENRPYLPHITLGRLTKNSRIEFQPILLNHGALSVKEMILYQSVPAEKHHRYLPLHHFFF